jgi:type IV pilus assembly protein PilM
MGIRTSIINVPPQVHGYENLEFSVYANAIGAMFKRNKDTERINLLETDTINNNKIKSDSSYFMLLGICAAASIAICAGAWLFLTLKNNNVEDEIELIHEKSQSAYAQSLDQQLTDLESKQNAVNTYRDGVNDAYLAYTSRPKPTSAQYEEIEKTIKDTVSKILKVENDESGEKLRKVYELEKLNYADGTYTVELNTAIEEDVPVPTLPTELVKAMRNLSDVSAVPFTGYSVEKSKQKEAEAQNNNNNNNNNNADADNNGNQDTELKKDSERLKIKMEIVMKDGGLDMSAFEKKKEVTE